MIVEIGEVGSKVVLLACIKQVSKEIRYVSTNQDVETYLKAHPDTWYQLEPSGLHNTITPHGRTNYGWDHGDIVCGTIKWDSAAGKVVSA